MILLRSAVQPIEPSIRSTLPCLVAWISADHSIWTTLTSSPSLPAMAAISSPSVPISLPSLTLVIGMSPLMPTVSLPGSIVLGAAACAGTAARAMPLAISAASPRRLVPHHPWRALKAILFPPGSGCGCEPRDDVPSTAWSWPVRGGIGEFETPDEPGQRPAHGEVEDCRQHV